MAETSFVKQRFARYALPLAGVLLTTLTLAALDTHVNATTVALALLLVVLVSAAFLGRNPALAASFVAMLCFNYFFFHPVHSWTISDPQNLVAWAAFTITAITAGELSAYARRRARESERLFAELQSAFEAATQAEALKQSEKLKSALLDAVTHDLRTPLTSIKAAVTTLIESEGGHRTIELDGDGRREFLAIINEETDRLNRFIESMVELARVEAGSLGSATSASVAEIVNTAVSRAESVASAHHLEVRLDVALPPLRVDGRAVAEVIYNLIENACKYSKAGSTVTVEGKRLGRMVLIAVTDEGVGIAREMRQAVFDKFVRLGRGSADGLGLGLAIARGIIEAQNGTITITGGINDTGTSVRVTLPAGEE